MLAFHITQTLQLVFREVDPLILCVDRNTGNATGNGQQLGIQLFVPMKWEA